MEPVDVFCKELPLDKNNNILIFFNEFEEIKLKKSKEYAIMGLSIHQEVESDFVAVADLDAQKALSNLIRDYIKKKEEPNLNPKSYNEELL